MPPSRQTTASRGGTCSEIIRPLLASPRWCLCALCFIEYRLDCTKTQDKVWLMPEQWRGRKPQMCTDTYLKSHSWCALRFEQEILDNFEFVSFLDNFEITGFIIVNLCWFWIWGRFQLLLVTILSSKRSIAILRNNFKPFFQGNTSNVESLHYISVYCSQVRTWCLIKLLTHF